MAPSSSKSSLLYNQLIALTVNETGEHQVKGMADVLKISKSTVYR